MLAFVLLSIVLFANRVGGYCEKSCSGHGTCNANDICQCYKSVDAFPAWTGNDCSLRTCPRGTAWVGDVVSANNMHPITECSNRGECDRRYHTNDFCTMIYYCEQYISLTYVFPGRLGTCICYPNFEGSACDRTVCPNDCNGYGVCYTEQQLADNAGTSYSVPWDAKKQVGCVCDIGYRGPDCSLGD